MEKPARYRLDDLHVEGVPVIWTLSAGTDVEGFLTVTARGRRIYRVYTDSPRRRASQDLPSFSEPSLWRPLYPAKWPDDLPPPAVIQDSTGLNMPTEPSPNSEPVGELDGWPYPELVLTIGKPGSKQEAEARVLRAIRTQRALDRLEDRPTGSTLWPPALMFKARMVAKTLRNSRTGRLGHLTSDDYDDFHIDRSELRALPDLWIPTRRDIGDIEYGVLNWMTVLSKHQTHVVHLRAANPVYSWRAMSSYFGDSEVSIKRVYAESIKLLWKRAIA